MVTLPAVDDQLVSIVIPCWGCQDYIVQAIESALAQSYQPLEVVVVEDHGPDDTYERARRIVDPRLRVHRNEHNLGQHRNKNRGLRLSSGRLIKYLDGDDLLLPDCVERLVRAWQEAGSGVGMVFGRLEITDQDGSVLYESRNWGVEGRFKGTDMLAALLRLRRSGSHFGNVTPSLLERSALEAVGGFPEDNAVSGDWEVFLKILCIRDVVLVPQVVGQYRLQPGSIRARNDCAEYTRSNLVMVQRLVDYFAKAPQAPSFLRDPRFLDEWRVWSSENYIMPELFHRLRGRPNQFAAIRDVFAEQGLAREFRRYLRRALLTYPPMALSNVMRRWLGIREIAPLFRRGALHPVEPAAAGRAQR